MLVIPSGATNNKYLIGVVLCCNYTINYSQASNPSTPAVYNGSKLIIAEICLNTQIRVYEKYMQLVHIHRAVEAFSQAIVHDYQVDNFLQ